MFSSVQKLVIGLFIAFVVIGLGFWACLFSVPPGEVYVRFDPLSGGIKEAQYGEGLHIKAPWISVYDYSIKTQIYTMSSEEDTGESNTTGVKTVTNEGLYVDLDISIQYRIDPTKAWEIRQKYGPEGQYQDVIVLPQIRSTLRDIISQFSAAEVYGAGKSAVELAIFTDLVNNLEPKNIIVEQVLLRNVTLPEQLVNSIENKKRAEQDALAMEYVLQKAKQEAEQKIIEAGGIAAANAIIADSITQSYLEWYWIESMKLNPHAIYIPIGEDGLPMFIQPGE